MHVNYEWKDIECGKNELRRQYVFLLVFFVFERSSSTNYTWIVTRQIRMRWPLSNGKRWMQLGWIIAAAADQTLLVCYSILWDVSCGVNANKEIKIDMLANGWKWLIFSNEFRSKFRLTNLEYYLLCIYFQWTRICKRTVFSDDLYPFYISFDAAHCFASPFRFAGEAYVSGHTRSFSNNEWKKTNADQNMKCF